MCCIADKQTKVDFLKDMNKSGKKYFTAWKALRPCGGASMAFVRGLGISSRPFQYSPGTHKAHVTEDTYDENNPKGIHVFIYRTTAARWARNFDEVLIPVQCHVDDLVIVGADEGFAPQYQEAVLTKIRIRKESWVKAGLPI